MSERNNYITRCVVRGGMCNERENRFRKCVIKGGVCSVRENYLTRRYLVRGGLTERIQN